MILCPLKTHGGKRYLAKHIIAQFPSNYEQMWYCEPFCGGASVFFQKEPSPYEELADTDWWTWNFFTQVRDNVEYVVQELLHWPYTQFHFHQAKSIKNNQLSQLAITGRDCAVYEFVIRRMSRGGMGKTYAHSNRLRGGIMGDENAYINARDSLHEVSKRLQGVNIILGSAQQRLMQCHKNDNMLFYLDPPYVKSTRTAKKVYSQEMSDKEHRDVADICKQVKGKILISGYNSPLYDELYGSWNKIELKVKNQSGQGKTKQDRTEVLWKNY